MSVGVGVGVDESIIMDLLKGGCEGYIDVSK